MKRIITILLLLFVVGLLHWWQQPLSADGRWYYQELARGYYGFGELKSMLGTNEYQPGAVVFILIVGLLWLGGLSYLLSLIVVNGALVLVLAKWFQKTWGSVAIKKLGFVLLAAGSIVLFRFELWVMMFVVGVVYWGRKEKWEWAILSLAVATWIKIFPVIWLPYVLGIVYKKLGLRHVMALGSLYLVAMFGLTAGYLLVLGGSVAQVYGNLLVQANKMIHVESWWGASIISVNLMKGTPIHPVVEGIWGVTASEWLVKLANWFWIAPLGLCYWWVWGKEVLWKKIEVEVLIWLAVVFLVFAKVLTAQYLLWVGLLVPLMRNGKKELLVTCLMLVFAQMVYPLFYIRLVKGFLENGSNVWVFGLLLVRNWLLLFLGYLMAKRIKLMVK